MPVRGSTGSLLPRQSCVEGRWPWWLVVPAAPDDPAQHRSDHHAATIQDLRDRLCGAGRQSASASRSAGWVR
jgi:hypothetical protein